VSVQHQHQGQIPSFNLSVEGEKAIADLASRHDLSREAVLTFVQALEAGNGQQAQFNHPDLGGMGQWSRGGMLMIGDMFNHALKAKVAALGEDAAAVLAKGEVFEPSARAKSTRWPADLGEPSSTGSQNDMQYALFPDKQRLAINDGGNIKVYDTGEHRIMGFGQQQGEGSSLNFTSQLGTVGLDHLKRVTGSPEQGAEPATEETRSPIATPSPRAAAEEATQSDHDAIFAKIEGLASLHGKGILTAEDFEVKKAELLGRL
jgi:hypothetical protein